MSSHMQVSQAPQRRLTLGPSARRWIRAAARVVNPFVLAIAGRRFMPIVGIVHHRGVKSRRLYTTPLGLRPLGDGFVMPLTFGQAANWYRNTVAAGGCVVAYLGATHQVGAPEIVDAAHGLRAFPRYERVLLTFVGIDEYLWVHELKT